VLARLSGVLALGIGLAATDAQADPAFVVAPGVSALVEPNDPAPADRVGFGPAVTIGFFDHPSFREMGRVLPGFQAAFSSALGPEGRFLADVGVDVVATVSFSDGGIDPFVSFGPVVLFSARADDAGSAVLGVRGDVGFHGMIFERLYWRLQGGLVGPVVGGLRAQLALGYGLF